MRRVVGVRVLLCVTSMLVSATLAAPTVARAQPGETPATVADASSASPDPAPPRHRPVPDYDGRPEPGPDAVDAALWVPRILFSPLYLVTEHLIRAPLTALLTEMERSDFFEVLIDVFVFGPERNIAVFPTGFYEFGFQPSIGVYGFWNDFLVDDNRFSVHAAIGGEDWLSLVVADTFRPRPYLDLRARVGMLARPDQQLGGIGTGADASQHARYGIETIDASLSVALRPWRRSSLAYEVGYRGVGYLDRSWDGQPSIATVYAPQDRPPAYETGFSALRFGARFVVDSRGDEELSSGGVRAVAHVAASAGFGGLPSSRWVRWGGELSLFTDVLGQGRVLSVTGVVDLASALDVSIVPFTELPELGGDGPMAGFQHGHVRGASLAALSVGYAWPLWAFLDGTLVAAVGSALDPHFEGFSPEHLRLSFRLGLSPRIAGEHAFELGLGFGTETFAQGTEIESVRFVIGGRSGL